MVDGLAAYLEVLTEREVSQIEHTANGVCVHTKGGGDGIDADAVLVTVPLGVLKQHGLKFSPPLPQWKRDAVERLGFGPIEKVRSSPLISSHLPSSPLISPHLPSSPRGFGPIEQGRRRRLSPLPWPACSFCRPGWHGAWSSRHPLHAASPQPAAPATSLAPPPPRGCPAPPSSARLLQPTPPHVLPSARQVVLLFEKRFWPEDADFFGCLPSPDVPTDELDKTRGEFFLFWNLERSHGAPALICISSGAFAVSAWRGHSTKGVINKALAVLKRTFGPQVTAMHRKSVVSDWGRNPYARGSYSYVAVGGSGRDYDELAWPVNGRVFFAGEHTNGQHPATATGAFLSGLREAQRIDEAARHGFAPPPPAAAAVSSAHE